MDWQCLLLLGVHLLHMGLAQPKEITITVNPKRLVQYIPERFLSMTVDPGTILLAGNLDNKEALNMAKGLSPSFVRLGGKSTNFVKFGKELFMDNTTITEEQWDSVNRFARSAGLDLIVSLNPTERLNGVWDSRDALQLISYSEKQGYTLAWQLGYDVGTISTSGSQLGRDIIRLRKILDGFPKFGHSPVFGPDFPNSLSTKDALFVRDLLVQAGPVLGAIFIQPRFKAEEDPGETIMNAVINLDTNVWSKAMRLGRVIPRKPIWIADPEISQGSGTEALSLARRLGVAARIGVQVVMRQLGPTSLKHPTPEFWMALLYKNLVGRGVLDARVNPGQNRTQLYIFSHCTQMLSSHKSIIDAGMLYDKGAVTVFGVNEGVEDIKISLRIGMKEEKVHVYSLTFTTDESKQTEDTFLNGQLLRLSPEGDLPIVSPRVVRRPSKSGILIPSRSVFFFVLPDVRSRTCSATPFIPQEVQELSRKLIQVVGEVLDKPVVGSGALNLPRYTDDDEEPGKLYVKFGKNLMSNTQNNIKPESIVTDPPKTDIIMTSTTNPPPEISVIAEQQNRRKRSTDTKNPDLNMEISSNQQHYIPSQKELVDHFNNYARRVYESSREAGTTENVQTYSVPHEMLNALKRVKVTFKPLGMSYVPTTESMSDFVTVNPQDKVTPERSEELVTTEETDDGDKEEESSDVKPEKQVLDDKGEDVFRKSADDDARNDEEIFQDIKPRPATQSDTESSGTTGDQSNEEVQGDESLREGESASQATDDGGDVRETTEDGGDGDEEVGTTEDLVGQDEPPNEPSDTQEEPASQNNPDANSIAGSSTSLPLKSTADQESSTTPLDNQKEEEEETEEGEVSNSDINPDKLQLLTNPPPPPDESPKDDDKFKLTTTEMPEVIAIDGINQENVDKLLLKMAGNNAPDVKNLNEKPIENNTINKTEDDSSPQKTVSENTLDESKNPKDDFEILDQEIKENDIRESNGLSNGPEIPAPESADETVKLARGVTDGVNRGQPVMLLLHPSMKVDEQEKIIDDTNDDNDDDDNEKTDASEQGNGDDFVQENKESTVDNGEFKNESEDVINPKDEAENVNPKDEAENIQENANTDSDDDKSKLTAPLQAVVVPAETLAPESPETESVTETIKNDKTADKINKILQNKGVADVSDVAKKLEALRTDAEKERRQKLIAIRNQILEAKQKFKALTRDDNWRMELQKREEELRMKFRNKLPNAPETLLSRPRRLSYYPEDGLSEEDVYGYSDKYFPPKRSDPYTYQTNNDDYDKILSHDTLSSALSQDRNHIIFPLDPKTPQAVVYDNKIIPAKLYGVININDGTPTSSKISTIPQPSSDSSFYPKYYPSKSYEPPKYSSPIIKSSEPYTINTRRNDDHNFLPVVVLSPHGGSLRRKRSLELPQNKFNNKERLDALHAHTLKKRSISSENKDVIHKKVVKEVISNEIHPESVKNDFPSDFHGNNFDYGVFEPVWGSNVDFSKNMEGRTFNLLQPLGPPPLPFRPPTYPGGEPFREQPPEPFRELPPEPFQDLPPSRGIFDYPFLPPPPPPPPGHPLPPPSSPPLTTTTSSDLAFFPEKRDPEPSQAYFFNVLQDKFKSLMGMLETLAVWCGSNNSK